MRHDVFYVQSVARDTSDFAIIHAIPTRNLTSILCNDSSVFHLSVDKEIESILRRRQIILYWSKWSKSVRWRQVSHEGVELIHSKQVKLGLVVVAIFVLFNHTSTRLLNVAFKRLLNVDGVDLNADNLACEGLTWRISGECENFENEEVEDVTGDGAIKMLVAEEKDSADWLIKLHREHGVGSNTEGGQGLVVCVITENCGFAGCSHNVASVWWCLEVVIQEKLSDIIVAFSFINDLVKSVIDRVPDERTDVQDLLINPMQIHIETKTVHKSKKEFIHDLKARTSEFEDKVILFGESNVSPMRFAGGGIESDSDEEGMTNLYHLRASAFDNNTTLHGDVLQHLIQRLGLELERFSL
ncbi:hypothetical protein F5877DRAFT_65872 [Lentinula edodes]|nr:hypothetical protein F5877DRAFT_65872 [Lentinula edodes]